MQPVAGPKKQNLAMIGDSVKIEELNSKMMPSYRLECQSDLDQLWDLLSQASKCRGWLVATDKKGSDLVLAGRFMRVRFVEEKKWEKVASYRWGNAVIKVGSGDFAIKTMNLEIVGDTWIDILSHLNHPALLNRTLKKMGGFYKDGCVRCYDYEQSDIEEMKDASSRMWIWQEQAFGQIFNFEKLEPLARGLITLARQGPSSELKEKASDCCCDGRYMVNIRPPLVGPLVELILPKSEISWHQACNISPTMLNYDAEAYKIILDAVRKFGEANVSLPPPVNHKSLYAFKMAMLAASTKVLANESDRLHASFGVLCSAWGISVSVIEIRKLFMDMLKSSDDMFEGTIDIPRNMKESCNFSGLWTVDTVWNLENNFVKINGKKLNCSISWFTDGSRDANIYSCISDNENKKVLGASGYINTDSIIVSKDTICFLISRKESRNRIRCVVSRSQLTEFFCNWTNRNGVLLEVQVCGKITNHLIFYCLQR